jgi:isoleucyl-tRNA synthetase
MAPVLCFTAEEVWQEIRALCGDEAWDGSSVHALLFPEPLEIDRDEALVERFQRLMTLREEVYKALEIARQEKRIGTGLEARVVIQTPDDETLQFLRSFGDELHFLFITSEVVFGETGEAAFASEEIAGLSVEVQKASGAKCERCWNYTTDVGESAEWPGICARCAGHVREILAETEQA